MLGLLQQHELGPALPCMTCHLNFCNELAVTAAPMCHFITIFRATGTTFDLTCDHLPVGD